MYFICDQTSPEQKTISIGLHSDTSHKTAFCFQIIANTCNALNLSDIVCNTSTDFDVPTAIIVHNIVVFGAVTPRSMLGGYSLPVPHECDCLPFNLFKHNCILTLHNLTLSMKTAFSSDKFVSRYVTTRC